MVLYITKAWKRADSPKALESKTTRDGTYDENLQRIGDEFKSSHRILKFYNNE